MWHNFVIFFAISVSFTIGIDIKIPTGLGTYNFDSLDSYCDESTGHFECILATGEKLCFPYSGARCHPKCTNRPADCFPTCSPTQYQCSKKNSSDTQEKNVCLEDIFLCDGLNHCPLGDDEHVETCKLRTCSSTQFACKSPGHCIDNSKRCDGRLDCLREGLRDLSDEESCVNKTSMAVISCDSASEFMCKDKSKCVMKNYVCDGFADCDDKSDEAHCVVKTGCAFNEFECDKKCLSNTLKCDGKRDCGNGDDEKNCLHPMCSFISQFYCSLTKKCISKAFLCDGSNDCEKGEDEVCPMATTSNINVCKYSDYWTCKDGTFCIMKKFKCDGMPQCHDGSDEFDCPTKVPKFSCPAGLHECNGSSVCVNILDVCNGKVTCPYPDLHIQETCANIKKQNQSVCAVNNGGCEHLCEAVVQGEENHMTAVCSCRTGYEVSSINKTKCVDVDECTYFGKCSQSCVNTIGSFKCSCGNGYVLKNGTSCFAPGNHKLLYGTASTINIYDRDVRKNMVVAEETSDFRIMAATKYLDFDFIESQVFYHTRNGDIGYFRLGGANGFHSKKILLNGMEADAIAFDWVNKLLFFAVPFNKLYNTTGYIGVVDIRKNKTAELIKMDCPRGLAVHPGLGYIYISMWCNSQPGIYRMNLDGRDLVKLIEGGVKRPGHLTIDFSQVVPRLYWTDSQLRGIYSSTLDGKDLRAVWHITPDYLGNVYDISVFEDRIYFNDFRSGTIYSINKFTGLGMTSEVFLAQPQNALMTVTVMHSLRQPQFKQLCKLDTCDQICVLSSANATTCICDRYYKMSNSTCQLSSVQKSKFPLFMNTDASTNNLSEADKRRSLMSGHVGTIASIVIGCLVLVVVVGGILVFCINRTSNKQSIDFNNENYRHNFTKYIPKIDSRTPLTEYDEAVITNNTNV